MIIATVYVCNIWDYERIYYIYSKLVNMDWLHFYIDVRLHNIMFVVMIQDLVHRSDRYLLQ